MDKEQLEKQLSDEERDVFLNANSLDCYQFVVNDERFASLIQKNQNKETLTDEEWEFILFRLYLVSCKALLEEEKVDFTDRILLFLSKIGMKISKKDKKLYNECYKMASFVNGFKKGKTINTDVACTLNDVTESKKPTDLDILLGQYEEADLFHRNFRAFMGAYKDGTYGQISLHERMYMRAFQNAYEREKELYKRRGETNS